LNVKQREKQKIATNKNDFLKNGGKIENVNNS